MIPQRWNEVDQYLAERLAPEDEALQAALAASVDAGLPEIAVSANQGKMLQVLALSVGAKRILEIGTLGGYSAIWMARVLADGGRLVTLEADPRHAAVARQNLQFAGVADRVELIEGPALDTLPSLDGGAPFDLVFIDADKQQIPDYFAWALKLTRPGSLILVDNVVRRGAVIEADSDDPAVQGVRRLNELLAAEPRVRATVVQTVGAKGYDGFAMAVVVESGQTAAGSRH